MIGPSLLQSQEALVFDCSNDFQSFSGLPQVTNKFVTTKEGGVPNDEKADYPR